MGAYVHLLHSHMQLLCSILGHSWPIICINGLPTSPTYWSALDMLTTLISLTFHKLWGFVIFFVWSNLEYSSNYLHNFHHLTAFKCWQLIGFAFFKLRQCHSKKPFNHFLPALLLFGLNPLILFSANSLSSLLDSTFGSFLPPDLCPSPLTLPVRWFLKYKRSRQIKENHCDGWGCFQPDQGGSRWIKVDQDGSRQIKGDQCDLWLGVRDCGWVWRCFQPDQSRSGWIKGDQGGSKEINVICG